MRDILNTGTLSTMDSRELQARIRFNKAKKAVEDAQAIYSAHPTEVNLAILTAAKTERTAASIYGLDPVYAPETAS